MKRKPPEAQLALQVEKLASAIREFNPQKIILFGSAARGDYTAESDLDVVVVMESDKNFFERTYEVMRRCHIDMPLDLLVYTPEEFESMVERQNPFICQVLKEGRFL